MKLKNSHYSAIKQSFRIDEGRLKTEIGSEKIERWKDKKMAKKTLPPGRMGASIRNGRIDE